MSILDSITALPFMPGSHRPVVSVIRLNGIIGSGGTWQKGLNLNALNHLLERAFAVRRLAAVALVINSPGGSPVQSALITTRIRALAARKGVAVISFAEDVAASGGYWLALAGDEIYADKNSIIGSIGVISAGFGFPELLAKAGIERRVYAAGTNKSMLDPFKPEKPADIKHVRTLQDEIHQTFCTTVRERRGSRLKGTEKVLFNGAFWTGQTAVKLGLIDGIGDVHTTLLERFGDDVRLRHFSLRHSWWQRRGTLAAVDEVLDGMQSRLLWQRYGL